MGLETGTYVQDLVETNPPGTDSRSQGDDHLRLIKTCVKNSFPKDLRAVSSPGLHQPLRYNGTSFANSTGLVMTHVAASNAIPVDTDAAVTNVEFDQEILDGMGIFNPLAPSGFTVPTWSPRVQITITVELDNTTHTTRKVTVAIGKGAAWSNVIQREVFDIPGDTVTIVKNITFPCRPRYVSTANDYTSGDFLQVLIFADNAGVVVQNLDAYVQPVL